MSDSHSSGTSRAITPVIPGTVIASITVDAPIEAVFAAMSDPDIRSVWAKLPGGERTYDLDFRVDGIEAQTSVFPNIGRDERLDVRTRFIEITRPRRIVSEVQLRLDDVFRMTSQVAWELTEIGDGPDAVTRVDYTEQYLVLVPTGDGTADQKERKGATPMMLRGFKITVEELR
jgi:uncharacterized protein YndB with AHSA1/START domain